MSISRIQAIDVVRLVGEPRHANALRWFYCKIAGLEDATPPAPPKPPPAAGATAPRTAAGLSRSPGDPSDKKTAPSDAPSAPPELRFRSGKIELTVQLTSGLAPEPIPYRVAIGVADLDAAMARLDEHRLPYQRFCGLSYSDRRIGLLDPAGNRIFLKQDWPDW